MFLNVLIFLSLGATLAILGMGIFAMLRGGEYAEKNSNKFMRWRVTAQGIALAVLFLSVWLKSQGS
jgi:predicted permease